MLFAQPHAPLLGLGLFTPQPAVPISGLFFVGHLPGNFGLGFPARVRKPLLVEDAEVFLHDFGEPITIDGVPCGDAIFSEPYLDASLGSMGMAAGAPRLLMPTANLLQRDPADPSDPIVELDDRKGLLDRFHNPRPFRYLMREVQPDSLLMCSVILALHPDQTTQ